MNFANPRSLLLTLFGLLVFTVLVVLIGRTDWVGHIGDDASYVGAATGLSTWSGYAEFERPDVRPETKHPPGYPLLILPMFWLGLGQTVVFQCVTAFFGFGSLLLLARYPTVGTLGAVLTGFNFYWLLFCQHLLSEVPYTFFLLAICLLVAKCGEEGEVSTKNRILLATFLGFSILLRTIGIVLVPLVLVALGLRRLPFRQWAPIPIYSGFMVAPFYLFSAVTGYRDDVAGYPGMLTVLKTNIPYYLESLPFLMGVWSTLADLSEPLDGIVCLVLLALLLWSGWIACREGLELEVATVFGFGMVLLLWPFQDPRLFVPLIPLWALILLRGGGALLCRLGVRNPYWVMFFLLFSAQLLRLSTPLKTFVTLEPGYARPAILGLINEVAKPGDVVVGDDPGVWLQCKTPVYPLAPEATILKNFEIWLENMALVDAKFVLIAKNLDQGRSLSMGETRSSDEAKLLTTLLGLSDSFRKIGEDNRYVLFEIVRDPRSELMAVGWFRLGHRKFFEEQGGFDELRKALVLNPNLPVARFFLAELLVRQGRRGEAVEQLEVLLHLHPYFDDARAMLHQISGQK